MLSLMLAGGHSCSDGMAAAGTALMDALHRAHHPGDTAGSLAWGSAHHHSEKFTSCFNHTPVTQLVHNSTQKEELDLALSLETYASWKYNS